MILHTFKLIFRRLWNKRIYTFVILLSLIVAFTCSNLLISFLVYETDTDKFHRKKDRIFQVFSNDPFSINGHIAYIPNYFYNYLTDNYPEVEEVCQISDLGASKIEVNENVFHDFKVLSVGSSFFSLFDFPLIHGKVNDCLDPDRIVLSRKKALMLFGKPDIVGNIVVLSAQDTTKQLMVSGVVDHQNTNSHLIFDALVHHSVFPKKHIGGASYVLLKASNLSEPLLKKVNNDVTRPGLLGPGKTDYFFNPLVDSYFSPNNKMGYMKTRRPIFLKMGYVICGLILFIAGFNFISLFLLFWQDRKKEIGIKKAMGVTIKGLLGFTTVEVGVYILFSFLLSLSITLLLIPVFNSIFGTNLTLNYLLNIKVAIVVLVILLFSGMLIIVFSIWKQWRMKPISLMSKDSSKVKFNGLLFTIQFSITIALAICSITIIRQMNYLESAPLGFNRKIIQLDNPDEKNTETLHVLKQQISRLPNVNNVAVGNGNPISGNMKVRYELENGRFYTPFLFGGDRDFLKTLDLKLLKGNLPSEVHQGKLVNETLVRHFNLKNPIGQLIPGTMDRIIGVVADFTCGSFKQKIPPVIISYYRGGRSLLIDYKGNDIGKLLPQIQAEWGILFPDYYFAYRILEEDLMKKYKEETTFYNLIVVFSMISMLLSCFGLFAFSWAVTQGRRKEMGIRKVLGASSVDILNLLTLTFTRRILIAFLLAAPIGYYLMDKWLTRFANKIDLNVWIFLITGLLVILVSYATLSLQTIRATMMNPVDEIRNE